MKDTVKESYSFFRPVYQTKDQVKAGIKNAPSVEIEKPGKIILKDHYLFLNDVDKGVHIIDIADPANPKKISFISIPGCVDMAINGNYLYADCYTDLYHHKSIMYFHLLRVLSEILTDRSSTISD
jgi:hypothetical protein